MATCLPQASSLKMVTARLQKYEFFIQTNHDQLFDCIILEAAMLRGILGSSPECGDELYLNIRNTYQLGLLSTLHNLLPSYHLVLFSTLQYFGQWLKMDTAGISRLYNHEFIKCIS